MSPNIISGKHRNYNNHCTYKETNPHTQLIPSPSKWNRIPGLLKTMKIISLFSFLLILVIVFRETRQQFLAPSISIFLATEEFIEPDNSKTESPPVQESLSQAQQTAGDNIFSTSSDDNGIDQPQHDTAGSTSNQNQSPFPDSSAEKDFNSKAEELASPSMASDSSNRLGKEDDSGPSKVTGNPHPTLNPLQQEDGQGETLKQLDIAAATETVSTGSSSPESQEIDPSSQGNGSKTDELKGSAREEEEPIPSYMEWAQKKQQELVTQTASQNGQVGSPATNGGSNGHNGQASPGQQVGNRSAAQTPSSSGTPIDANLKNFASPDCGAKVVQSNSGSTNAGGVLSSSHDEYMLNKCGVPIWFVVELCEPLTIEKVSLGNLELFSSSPKEFEVGISDRYPTREWVKLGPFPLPDARAIHPIALPSTNSSTFGKFLKVSILSHHGSEHFCPLSVIRVNGKSEYEVLESETTHQEDTDKEESGLYEEQLDDQPRSKGNENSVVGRAKDAVLNIVNAVKAFSGSSSTLVTSDENTSSLRSQCQSVIQCIPVSPLRDEIYYLLSCKSTNLLPFLATQSPWCGWDYCQDIFSRQSIGLPWQPEGFFSSLFGGPTVLHAVCHFYKPLKAGCTSVLGSNNSFPNDYSSSLQDVQKNYVNDSLNTLSDSGVNLTQEDVSPPTALPATPPHELESQVGTPKTVPDPGSSEPFSEHQSEAPQALPGPGFVILETQIPAPNPNIVDEGSQSIPQQVPGVGAGSQQKESVFVRLSNRIKTLERNQSLTASYLEELSRRFKKQNEDNSILNEWNKKIQNETKVKLLQVDDYYRQELQSLRRNVDDVRERLFTVQLQRSLLVIVCFSQTLLIVGGCLWVKRRLKDIHIHPLSESVSKEMCGEAQSSVFKVGAESNRYMIGRKRSNSDVTPSSINEKSKKLKKKKRNLAEARAHMNHPPNPLSNPTLQNPKNTPGYTFSGSPSKAKENIDPDKSSPNFNLNPGTVPLVPSLIDGPSSTNGSSFPSTSATLGQRPNSLLTKVDSPFTLHSTIFSSSGAYLNSGVSASGRFALLASPGMDSAVPDTRSILNAGLKRVGSGSSATSSSTTSTLDGTRTKMILSSHLVEPVASGKKGKKMGLKAFMPKIFDR